MEMSADPLAVRTDAVLHGERILSAIKAARVEYVLSVPDIVTSRGLLFPIAKDPAFKLIRVCKEDECIGIAAGLSYGNKRAITLIQLTGMLYAMNAIRGVAVELAQPICMMIGLLGREPERPPRQSRSYGVRIVEPVLDAMGIEHHLIESDADVAKIAPAIEKCYEKSVPVALLIGRSPS